MANNDQTSEASLLRRALSVLSKSSSRRSNNDINLLGKALSLYFKYYESATKKTRRPDPNTTVDTLIISDLVNILHFLEAIPALEEEEVKDKPNIPSNIEDLVYQYQEAQAQKIEADNSVDSVSETVKRARTSWQKKHLYEQLLKNKTEEQQKQLEKNSDNFFTQAIDSKSQNQSTVIKPITSLAKQAVDAQLEILQITLSDSQKTQAINDVVYIALTGVVDLSHINNLNLVSQQAILNINPDANIPIKEIDKDYRHYLTTLDNQSYTDEPEKELAEIKQRTLNSKEEIEKNVNSSSQKLSITLNRNNIDFDTDLDSAKSIINNIHSKLQTAIPNPTNRLKINSPLENYSQELDQALKDVIPELRINTTGLGSRAIGILETTHSESRFINSESVSLYSRGLTPDKFSELELYAQKNPESKIGQLYSNNPDIFNQVRFQLKKIHESPLGQSIKTELTKNNTGPLAPLHNFATKLYNQLPAPVAKFTKNLFNPLGNLDNYINRKIGKYIGEQLINRTNSVVVRQIGEFFLSDGLRGGITKLFASLTTKAAPELVTKLATKAGITVAGEGLIAGLSAALGISTGGVSLLIEAAVFLAFQLFSFVWNKFKGLLKQIYGEDVDFKDLLGYSAAILGTLMATTTAALTSIGGVIITAIIATKAAAISAFWVMVISIISVIIFWGYSLLAGTVLSTFVQLDSLEKVNYSINFPGIVNPPGTIIDCSIPYEPLSFPNTTSNSVAKKAWEIVNNLQRGFWCYWNKSPDYPELFDEAEFKRNPNPPFPGPIQSCGGGNCLFWCTWLVNKAYGVNMSLGAASMAGQFQAQNKYLTRSEAKYTNILPGAAVFFNTPGGEPIVHVGIVYSVTKDAIVFVQSNSATKYGTITVGTDGVPQNIPYNDVHGFGGNIKK